MPHPTSIPTHSKRFPPDNQRNPGDDHFPPDLSLTHPPQPTCPPGCIGRPCPPRFPNGCPSPTFPTPTLPLSAHSISDPYDSSTTSLPSDSSPPPDSATTYSSHPSSTVTGSASSLFTSTGTLTTYSTIQSTLTATATATATWTRTSLAATGVTTTLLSSDPWPTSPVIVDPDDHSLGLLSVLGIVLGVLLALVLIALFLFLLRRGTFGSGTLLGFKYGDARFEGLSRTGRDMKETRAGYAVNPFDDPSHTTLPSYPSSTSTASHVTLPFLPPSKHRSRSRSPSPTLTTTTTTTTRSAARSSEADSATLAPSARATASLLAMGIKPPLSPVAWSTSPSAFDNVYGRAGAGAGTRGPRSSTSASVSAASASASVADSSDVATLVSQPRYTRSSLSYAPGAVGRATSPAPTLRTVDSADTLRTRETAGASTIDGVRISSWHSSDSEETELIGRTSCARYG